MNELSKYIRNKRIELFGERGGGDAARKAGINRQMLSRIERGDRFKIKPATLKQISQGWGVPMWELMVKAGYVDMDPVIHHELTLASLKGPLLTLDELQDPDCFTGAKTLYNTGHSDSFAVRLERNLKNFFANDILIATFSMPVNTREIVQSEIFVVANKKRPSIYKFVSNKLLNLNDRCEPEDLLISSEEVIGWLVEMHRRL